MRETKRQMSLYSFYDHTGIEKHLARMAERGWLLCKIGQLFWHYRRIEPKKITFSVCYFPQATIYDPRPSEGQEEFYDLCAHAGWTLAGSSGQLQVFCHQGENPTPIDTDPVTQVETIHRSMRRAMLPGHLLLAAALLWQLGFCIYDFCQDPVDYLATTSTLLMPPMFLLLLLATLYEVAFYFRWHRKAVRAAEDGVFLPIRTNRAASLLLLGGATLLLLLSSLGSRPRFLTLLLWCGAYGFIVLLAYRAKDAMKRRGAPRWATMAVTIGVIWLLTAGLLAGMVSLIIGGDLWRERQPAESYQFHGHTFSIYHDQLPLTVAELTAGYDEVRYSTEVRREESPLLARTQYRQDRLLGQDPAAPELEYTIVRVKVPALYGLCRGAMLEEDTRFEAEYRPTDAGPWGALEAYRLYRQGEPEGWYLLLWEDRFAELYSRGLELTPERMALMGERLRQAG